MKKGLLLLFLTASVFANAQTLKDALFSGMLKNQSGTVIRKDDDLSTKIDTARTATAPTPVDAAAQPANTTATVPAASATDAKTDSTATAATTTTESTDAPKAAVAPKNNTAAWKTFMDTVVSSLKSDALSSKKIKRGSYFVLVPYTIAPDGQVTIGDVTVSPENAILQQQITARLETDTPRLSPVLDGGGTPRKVTKRYSFTLTKE